MTSTTSHRRRIAARSSLWAQTMARALTRRGVRPNLISIASMGFAACGGLAFWGAGAAQSAAGTPAGQVLVAVLLLLGAAGIVLRLLANLLDGMVAVEGGLGQPDGGFWNEAPDRVSDVLLIVGAGLGVAAAGNAPAALGWCAALLALGTAYVRELGARLRQTADFGGPMAKQHRMWALAAGAGLSIVEPAFGWTFVGLTVAVWLIAAGSALTILLRARRLVLALRAGGPA